MANEKAVLFIGANRPIVGREAEAMALWSETGAWLESQQKAGWFARWDGFWLTPHGGDMNSAFTCYGDRAKLDEWRRTDAFEAWVFRASTCLSDLGVIPGVSYAAASETMARRASAVGANR
ncbi:MAG: hypothetical protein H0T89_19345 [Deltaproteobacteria bacterium]|nr:hypothetical protein [Deltaproteobacteria bacterium]MDQ3365740.1 hypothetical protein [Myxococcota bacterium]